MGMGMGAGHGLVRIRICRVSCIVSGSYEQMQVACIVTTGGSENMHSYDWWW